MLWPHPVVFPITETCVQFLKSPNLYINSKKISRMKTAAVSPTLLALRRAESRLVGPNPFGVVRKILPLLFGASPRPGLRRRGPIPCFVWLHWLHCILDKMQSVAELSVLVVRVTLNKESADQRSNALYRVTHQV